MEKRLTSKIEDYQRVFKDNVREWLSSQCVQVTSKTGDDITGEFLRYLYDYKKLELVSDDFQRRKRVTNAIPLDCRCIAKRANGDQCTRRRKDGKTYCGTHEKGTPHGIVETDESNALATHKVNIWAQDIRGIHYYLDKSNNVYDPSQVIRGDVNPAVIARWSKDSDGQYHIPEYGI